MKTTRGRPRKYSIETTKNNILKVFWRKGYSATTIDDLKDNTGLNKPSLYKFFSSKEEAFLLAYKHYMDTFAQEYLNTLHAKESTHSCLTMFFDRYIDVITGEYGPGCLIGSVMPAESVTSESIRIALKNSLDSLRTNVLQTLTCNDNSMKMDKETATTLIVNGFLSMGILSRAGYSEGQLKTYSEQIISSIF